MTNQYTKGDRNNKALLSAFRGARRGKVVQSRSATLAQELSSLTSCKTIN